MNEVVNITINMNINMLQIIRVLFTISLGCFTLCIISITQAFDKFVVRLVLSILLGSSIASILALFGLDIGLCVRVGNSENSSSCVITGLLVLGHAYLESAHIVVRAVYFWNLWQCWIVVLQAFVNRTFDIVCLMIGTAVEAFDN